MEQLSYSLDLSLSGPGFSIVGGYDPQEPTGTSSFLILTLNDPPKGDHAIILSAVQEHGAASRAGLQVGDQLIAVNGFPLGAETSHEEAVSIVKQAIMSRVKQACLPASTSSMCYSGHEGHHLQAIKPSRRCCFWYTRFLAPKYVVFDIDLLQTSAASRLLTRMNMARSE